MAGGCAWQGGGVHGRYYEIVNEQAVCILLECILVEGNFSLLLLFITARK